MRGLTLIITLILSIVWVWLLNNPLGTVPALGKLLQPVSGFWGNAEPVKEVATQFSLPEAYQQSSLQITFDERLVPHVKAKNDADLYFAQGYLHAYYRLWQMDMQTRAAAGRISEVAGEKAFDFDRNQRRKGMVWAAENSLKAMEAQPETKKTLDAYTEGVNTFINNLAYKDYPLEYKLMGFEPEPWTNLKCALLLKYMADDLTGNVDDIAMTYLRDALPAKELDKLFPEKIQGSQPVIPIGTGFTAPSMAVPAVPRGDVFAHFDTIRTKKKDSTTKIVAQYGAPKQAPERESGMGSNNWVIGNKLTSDSSTILCNDPHLGLNLPAIWYELQLTAPGINCYGVSIPGAPGIIIGFNDSISWGFTNNYRDVKDFYEIKTEDPRLYIFDGKEVPFNERHEAIYTKGKKEPFIDTIRFTIHGPLMYDEHHPEPSGSGKTLAMTWMAHRATNELLSVYLYNRAQNYTQFVQGIQHFECPAQNFVYTDRLGNIAIWGQGRFINKWKDQGKYVMRGDISATLWGDTIPMRENPNVLNPPQNYLASANQNVTDNTYPYWYNGDFTEFRSWEINDEIYFNFVNRFEKLNAVKQSFTKSILSDSLQEMYFLHQSYICGESIPSSIERNKIIQTSNFSILNFSFVNGSSIGKLFRDNSVRSEYFNLKANDKSATNFQIFWYHLYKNIWQDDFRNYPEKIYPSAEVTMQLLLTDTSSTYYDDVTTTQKEGLRDMVNLSYQQTLDSIKVLEKNGGTEWYKVKNTSVTHLAKIKAFSYDQLKTGGWGNTINAMKQNHGPSWRMIVSMKQDKIEAHVVYPGGQSGNPGSKYYANFLDYWVAGNYYEVKFK